MLDIDEGGGAIVFQEYSPHNPGTMGGIPRNGKEPWIFMKYTQDSRESWELRCTQDSRESWELRCTQDSRESWDKPWDIEV